MLSQMKLKTLIFVPNIVENPEEQAHIKCSWVVSFCNITQLINQSSKCSIKILINN